jgi:hypothetical protein
MFRSVSVIDHRYPMPHLSQWVDMREEKGHQPGDGEAFSFDHIWMFIPSVCLFVGKHDGEMNRQTDGINIHMWWDKWALPPSGPMPKTVRNFPCQTLKISKVFLVVMGS